MGKKKSADQLVTGKGSMDYLFSPQAPLDRKKKELIAWSDGKEFWDGCEIVLQIQLRCQNEFVNVTVNNLSHECISAHLAILTEMQQSRSFVCGAVLASLHAVGEDGLPIFRHASNNKEEETLRRTKEFFHYFLSHTWSIRAQAFPSTAGFIFIKPETIIINMYRWLSLFFMGSILSFLKSAAHTNLGHMDIGRRLLARDTTMMPFFF